MDLLRPKAQDLLRPKAQDLLEQWEQDRSFRLHPNTRLLLLNQVRLQVLLLLSQQ